jgi:hypothetical protein
MSLRRADCARLLIRATRSGATTSERGGIKVGLVNSADFLLVAQCYDGYSRSARMPAIQRCAARFLINQKGLGQSCVAVLCFRGHSDQENRVSPTALVSRSAEATGSREDAMGGEGLTRRTMLRSAALATTALAAPFVRCA